MFAEPVRLCARGAHLPADLQQLLFAIACPDFEIDFAGIDSADASLVHASHLDVAALPDTSLVVFAPERELATFEAMPQVVAALEWPADAASVRRSLALAARWLKREQQLRALASTDPLTGLLNRRGFEERAHRIIARSRAEADGAAMLLIDLDHFKRVNDTYGHAAGDAVLRHVGRLLSQLTRPNDIVGRIGGEEIAVLLSGVSEELARETGERLRLAIADEPIAFGDQRLKITASIGFALNDAIGDYDLLMQEADDALYAAKSGGRNRVVGGDASISVEPVPSRDDKLSAVVTARVAVA